MTMLMYRKIRTKIKKILLNPKIKGFFTRITGSNHDKNIWHA